MEPDDLEDKDSAHRSKDNAICLVQGMESVVATVSGYHGTERFKLIKLIAQVGANYVGAMSRSTTHLVCWRFEGKKYNLARRIGAHIVSHRWLEHCLKEGKRISEGPYTKKSGKEAGPISWELPISLDTHQKKRCVVNREWDSFPAFSSASDCLKAGKDTTRPENGCLKWSDSHLLKELCEWPGESSLYSSRKKKKLSNVVQNDAGGEPARRSRRLMKKIIDDHSKDSLIVSSDEVEIANPKSVNLHTLRCTAASSSQRVNLATRSDNEERGTQAIEQVEKRYLKKSPIWDDSESSKTLVFDASSPHETNLRNDHCKYSGDNSSCDIGVDNDGASKEGGGELVESAIMQRQAQLSCVICWTDYSSTRGVLACGHRFCYSCILGWADCLASRGKISTCPLCKASFTKISKVDEAGSLDQKIYSQTIPCGSSNIDIFMLAEKENDNFRTSSVDSVCYECHNREPEGLLVSCHICQSQWVHSCCLDPPLVPWTCIHCRDLRMLYQRFR